jgi:anaerobic nitric oxide reductase flavorubredoxin
MKIVNAYMDWCTGKTVKNKAVIVFDTMWGSTDKMARAIGEGISYPRRRSQTCSS